MFEIQVKVEGVWVSVEKTNAKLPYRFDTRKEADRMLDICYPDQRREDRLDGANNQCQVVEVTEKETEPIKFEEGTSLPETTQA